MPGFESTTPFQGDRDRALLLAPVGENSLDRSDEIDRGQVDHDGRRHAALLQGPFPKVIVQEIDS